MPTDTAAIDKLIYDLDACMNGETPGEVVAPSFTPACMEKMRVLVRSVMAGK